MINIAPPPIKDRISKAFLKIFSKRMKAKMITNVSKPKVTFKLLSQQLGWGNSLMYVFAVVQSFFMLAQLAVLIDAAI